MMIILSNISSLTYLQSLRIAGRASELLSSPPSRAEERHIARGRVALGVRKGLFDLIPDAMRHEDGKVDLLVSKDSERRFSKLVIPRVWDSDRFPPGSLLKITDEVAITSVEETFLLMARQLELEALIELGLELCGTYAASFLPRWGSAKVREGVHSVAPLTSARKLGRFISRCSGRHGVKRCREALKYIRDGSASPWESRVALMAGLPRFRGGLGLGIPQFNAAIRIPGMERIQRIDLLWPRQRVGVEYDSVEHHSTESQLSGDAQRRARFASAGVLALSLRKAQCASVAALQESLEAVRKRQGKPKWDLRREYVARNRLLRRLIWGNILDYPACLAIPRRLQAKQPGDEQRGSPKGDQCERQEVK